MRPRTMTQWARRMNRQWGKPLRMTTKSGDVYVVAKVGVKYLTLETGHRVTIRFIPDHVRRIEVAS